MDDHRPRFGAIGVIVAALSVSVVAQDGLDESPPPLGPPPLYEALREARLEAVGHIRDARLDVDRLALELTDGDLYLLPPVGGRLSVAVFLGEGTVRGYPPDGVEHQQLEKFIDDDDALDEAFDRVVVWFSDDTGERLRNLADPGARQARHLDRAQDLLADRRKRLLEDQQANPDSRVVVDLLAMESGLPPPQGFFFAQIDTDDHDWLTVEIEPREPEEVRVFRFDRRKKIADVWMSFHASRDFAGTDASAAGFPRNPEIEGKLYSDKGDDDDDWHARDLGLPLRPAPPDSEYWTPRLTVVRTDVDMAIEGNGDITAVAALAIEPHEPMTALRLRLSPVLEVTNVAWALGAPLEVENVRSSRLLGEESSEPDEPVVLGGEPVHFVQETHRRRLDDDLYEPWVSIVLPRLLGPGERFTIQLAYHGTLLEDLRGSDSFVLKDTLYWTPRHPDSRRTRMSLTFRTPRRLRVASGADFVDEHVVEETRVARWVSDEPIRSMSFNLGEFDVTEVDIDGVLPVSVYADGNHLGFAPGNRAKTIADLTGSIKTFEEYFGPYPFTSLLVTETPMDSGQAFPGLVLLSFQAFGQLLTGEAEFFRAHEVAHQWWGAAVEWDGYRDQWISEGFAHYAAALYVLAGLGREDRFLDILEAWTLDVLGTVNLGRGLGLTQYGFPPSVIRQSDAHAAGPLVAGYRLMTSDAPMDYRLLAYEKGAFVLHMIRMMLVDLETGDDARFRDLMRDLASAHRHEPLTTGSFEAAVTRAFGEPMDWFFDQWVYDVSVPTYDVDLDVVRSADEGRPRKLRGRIRQEDVPDGFRMPVPVVIRFDDHPPIIRRIWVDAETVQVEIPLPAEPRDIDFNYHHGVLARVR